MPDLASRQGLIAHLRRHEILGLFHYLPLHTSEMGRRLGYRPGDCPVTEDVSDRLIRLPLFSELSDADQTRVIEAVCEFQVKV
jgi:dTDP-4-amino-4,6-dideoxygalactose transaminase